MALCDWQKVTLGRTGLHVSRIGLGSSYGVGAADVERAFDRGINYFYWGSTRTEQFGRGITAVAHKARQDAVVVVQSYARFGTLVRVSVESALKRLGLDYVDLVLLGLWNAPVPARVMDSARALVSSGKARHVLVSCHHRPTIELHARNRDIGAIMVRYNAAHRGAEREVFPKLGEAPPGVIAYTATRWGALLDPSLMPEGETVPTSTDCYRFALSRPEVNVCLAGPGDGVELDLAMRALDLGPLDPDELARMRRIGDSVHARARQGARRGGLRVLDWLAGSPAGAGDDAGSRDGGD